MRPSARNADAVDPSHAPKRVHHSRRQSGESWPMSPMIMTTASRHDEHDEQAAGRRTRTRRTSVGMRHAPLSRTASTRRRARDRRRHRGGSGGKIASSTPASPSDPCIRLARSRARTRARSRPTRRNERSRATSPMRPKDRGVPLAETPLAMAQSMAAVRNEPAQAGSDRGPQRRESPLVIDASGCAGCGDRGCHQDRARCPSTRVGAGCTRAT